MKIEYIHGDLMQAPEGFAVQGCNAQGAMGSGVAKLYRDHDENIYTVYRAEYERNGLKVGQIVPVVTHHPSIKGDELILFNAITQEFFGREEGHRYVSYDGMALAFSEINSTMFAVAGIAAANNMAIGLPRVAMPLIGAGLAQGRWPIIAAIIEAHSFDFQPVVYLHDGNIPA